MLKKWQAISLWKRVLIGMVLGLLLGLLSKALVGEQPVWTARKIQSVDAESQTVVLRGGQQLDITADSGLILASGEPFDLAAGDIQRLAEGDQIQIPGEPANIVFGNTWYEPLGNAFVRLIKMLIIPLILTTLVVGVTSMGDPKKLGTLGARTIALYLFTTLFAVSLGLLIGTIIRPGAGINYQTASASDLENVSTQVAQGQQVSFVDNLLQIIPENPVEALANTAVLPTIFFAIMIGIGILYAGSDANPLKEFFDASATVAMRVTTLVMELAPVGVFFLMAWVICTKGFGVLLNVGLLAFSLYFACAVQIFLIYGGVLVGLVLRLPIRSFFRGAIDAQGVAFSTASSSATLPITISCAEKHLGVENSVAASVLPLGATINMDGTAIYLGLVALFAVQADGISIGFGDYVMVAMTATLISIGAAGIPSAGLLLAATVLGVVGIENEKALLVIAFIFPFDRLLDMMRTMTNVTGDMAVACCVAKWEGQLDESVFRDGGTER